MNKEQIFDTIIDPELDRFVELCRKHGISMVAAFHIPSDIDPNAMVIGGIPDENGCMPKGFVDFKTTMESCFQHNEPLKFTRPD